MTWLPTVKGDGAGAMLLLLSGGGLGFGVSVLSGGDKGGAVVSLGAAIPGAILAVSLSL